MKLSRFLKIIPELRLLLTSFLGALLFYTIVPLPKTWTVDLHRIARWGVFVGLLVGGGLGLGDAIATHWDWPRLTQSVLVIAGWLWLTGGLHLDGVIDSADGLAVTDPKRRLSVMSDSMTGAFGVMAAVILLLLKIVALSELALHRGWILMGAAAWGRWGQVVAIAHYPYLKPMGKGAFHQQYLRSPQDILLGFVGLLGWHLAWGYVAPQAWGEIFAMAIGGGAIAYGSGYWFYRRFGGHTGDTYGAVIEWTEAFYLCLGSVIFASSMGQ